MCVCVCQRVTDQPNQVNRLIITLIFLSFDQTDLINIFLIPFISVIASAGANQQSASLWDNPYSQPYFDNGTKREITVTVGQTAMLHCKVRNLGDRAVSIPPTIPPGRFQVDHNY